LEKLIAKVNFKGSVLTVTEVGRLMSKRSEGAIFIMGAIRRAKDELKDK